MKISWWKICTFLFLMYSFIAGLLIHLKPSVTDFNVVSYFDNGTILANIKYYNGNLQKSSPPTVWLYKNKRNILANQVAVIDKQTLQAYFTFTANDSNTNFNVILETPFQRDTLPYALTYLPNNNTIFANEVVFNHLPQIKLTGIFGFPNRPNLYETIRNLFFHVPLWFAMMFLAALSVYYSFRLLKSNNLNYDLLSETYVKLAIFFGILGLITGSLWARFTWGDWWVFDIKLNGAALTVIIYIAYLVLRSSVYDEVQRAKISSVYSIFAFFMMLLFVMIVPRIYDSLHPGNGGNPGFNTYDMDSSLRMVFYTAVLGFIGLSLWISQIIIRYKKIKIISNEKI